MTTKILLILASLILITGCGKGPNTIDPAFQPIYTQFLADAKSNNVDIQQNQSLTIKFTSLDTQANPLGETIGDCDLTGQNPVINIDPQFWAAATPSAQIVLVYHELGHCLLFEAHDPNPDEIMYAVINTPETVYPSDKSAMISYLFSKRNN